jgi:DNA-binding MarR family transcriptional regulator
MTHGTADGLPSDQDLAERYGRIQALATDPLTLPILRALLRLAFQGKRMQATAAELAAAIGRDTAAVEAALKPLVPVKLIQRRLAEDDTILYEWDGGDIAMIVLIAG